MLSPISTIMLIWLKCAECLAILDSVEGNATQQIYNPLQFHQVYGCKILQDLQCFNVIFPENKMY